MRSKAFYSLLSSLILFIVHCRIFLVLFCLYLNADVDPLRSHELQFDQHWLVVATGEGSSRGILPESVFHAAPPCSLHASTLHLYSFLVSLEMLLPAFHVTVSLFCIHYHFVCWPCHVSPTSLLWALIGQWWLNGLHISKGTPSPSGKGERKADQSV